MPGRDAVSVAAGGFVWRTGLRPRFSEKNVQTRTLGNGISVIALNRGYSPTLALVISFRVGSADESYRTAGAAHMLEHMLFKGTDVIGTKDYKKEKKLLDEIEAIGEALDGLRVSNPGDRRIPVLEKKLKNWRPSMRNSSSAHPTTGYTARSAAWVSTRQPRAT